MAPQAAPNCSSLHRHDLLTPFAVRHPHAPALRRTDPSIALHQRDLRSAIHRNDQVRQQDAPSPPRTPRRTQQQHCRPNQNHLVTAHKNPPPAGAPFLASFARSGVCCSFPRPTEKATSFRRWPGSHAKQSAFLYEISGQLQYRYPQCHSSAIQHPQMVLGRAASFDYRTRSASATALLRNRRRPRSSPADFGRSARTPVWWMVLLLRG